MFLQTTDTLTFVPKLHLYNMCDTEFTLYVCDLTWGHGGGVKWQVKEVISVKPRDI